MIAGEWFPYDRWTSYFSAITAIVAIMWKPGLIYRNNHPPLLLNCYLYVLQTYRTHPSKLRLLLVFTFLPVCFLMLPVCCSFVLVCDSYVTRMYSYVFVCHRCIPVCTRMLLVCNRMLLVCTRVVFYSRSARGALLRKNIFRKRFNSRAVTSGLVKRIKALSRSIIIF